jgi:hypothetical protein
MMCAKPLGVNRPRWIISCGISAMVIFVFVLSSLFTAYFGRTIA